MSFANPEFGFLFFVIFSLHILSLKRGKQKFYIDHSNVSDFNVKKKNISVIHLIHLLRYLLILCLIIGLMRPQKGEDLEKIPESGIDIVLAVDTSGSMKALDFERNGKNVNRLEIVKEVLKKFILKRRGDRMSIVTFGETAFTLAPLTNDIDALLTILNDLEIGMAGEATAIGSAMGVAINRLKDLEAESKIIILLTDGRNNSGKIGPIEMSSVAKEIGAKVYTIGIGKIGGKAPFEVDSFFGKRIIYQNVDLDVETLTKIANDTGGAFFNATNLDELNNIYTKISDLEKRELEVQTFTNYTDLYFPAVLLGLIILLLELVFRSYRLKSFP